MSKIYLPRLNEAFLFEWITNNNRKPLIVRGARQTGKSTLVREFAKLRKFDLIEINLEENFSLLRQSFEDGRLDLILESLERISGHSLKSKQPKILFLDEVQAIPSALQSLRYFYEKMPNLPVIAAGSTLEFVLSAPGFSMPVGRVAFLNLAPLTFKEFLHARQRKDLISIIENANVHDPASLSYSQHMELMQLTTNFLMIGGMPEIVVNSLTGNQSSFAMQSLITSYRSDIQKYPSTALIRDIVRQVFDSLPGVIAQKIKYSKLAPDRPARDVRKALNLLLESGLALECLHSHASGVPLLAQVEHEIRKIFFLDVGLLLGSLGLRQKDIPDYSDPGFINDGAIAEQFVAQELSATLSHGHRTPLTYWLRDKKSQNAEVDFVIAIGKNIIPIEVKAGAAGTLRSLSVFCETKNSSVAVRFNTSLPSASEIGPRSKKVPLISLPMYLTSEVERVVRDFHE